MQNPASTHIIRRGSICSPFSPCIIQSIKGIVIVAELYYVEVNESALIGSNYGHEGVLLPQHVVLVEGTGST